MRTRSATLLLALLAAGVACDDDDDIVAPTGEAQVRLANASSAAQTVDVLLDGTVIASNLAFQGEGACVTIDAGLETLTFRSGGTVIGTVTETFLDNEEYTAVLFGATTPEASLVVDDFPVPAAGTNVLRFINVSGLAGDVFVTEPDVEPTGTPDVAALADETVTVPQAFPTAETRARLFPAATTATPIADVTVPALDENLGTVLFTGGTTATTGFVVEPCPLP